ncbi:MAG: pyridoxal phosphate-dependent decarboxylase family protein [Candidatus Thorarchaeota archaeon]
MKSDEFRKYAHELADWMADYLDNVENYPVKPSTKPNDILNQLPIHPPNEHEPFDAIFNDFKNIIIPGVTHWQSPNFMAYFPANSSRISVLAEMLTATLGLQCMIWLTSPSATELEERVMEWLREMLGLPSSFTGVIQDTASTSTLVAILTAREKKTNYQSNTQGMNMKGIFTTYCSEEAHSSVEKDVKIAGLGKEHLRKIKTDENFAMIPEELEKTIKQDLEQNFIPLCVIATMGSTSSTAVDPLRKIGEICHKYQIWFHVDGALSGSALILPEKRWMSDGMEYVDSFVFNPHKWLFTNFDLSAYYVKDVGALIQTFEILPEYLKTKEDKQVNNYRDWGIQLGRRFRALKLWFVIRHYGVSGLQEKIRFHLDLTKNLKEKIEKNPNFELLAPVPVNTICFRYKPQNKAFNDEQLDELNVSLLEKINNTGKLFLTHTKLRNRYTLRIVIGQTEVTNKHVERAWDLITTFAHI